jgi:hypothetical protein
MLKWADFLISAVKSGSTQECIDFVEVHSDIGCVVCETLIVSRAELIANLKKGCTYSAIFRTASGKWRKGEDVCLVNVNGKDYVKVGNKQCTPCDSFASVPEF